MENLLLSKNQTDWFLCSKLGIQAELLHHKLEYASELRAVRNLKMKTKSLQFDESRKAIISLSYRFDGKFIATTHSDHSVRVMDLVTGNIVSTLYGHLRTPWTVKWHPTNPNLLASGCLGGMIILWDVRQEKAFKTVFMDDRQSIDSLDFHPSLDLLVATCYDSVFLWDYMNQEQPIRIIQQPQRAIVACLFAGGGELLLVGSKEVKGEEFEETGRVEEYLLKKTTTYEVSKPIEITSRGIFFSDRGLTVSNCGMFLLMAIDAPPSIEPPKYGILGYGPALDRESLIANDLQPKKDLSHYRSFSRIMQQSINADSEAEVIVDSSHQDVQCSQYGFDRSAKCDIGFGKVKSRLAVISLDPETKGYILEFINIRDSVDVISVDFNHSNNFILLCTENKYPIYNNDVQEDHATVRVIQSSTWNVVYQHEFITNTPNSAAWNPINSSFACGLCNGELVCFV